MTWSAKLAPWLSVADAGRAVDFYKSAFGAVEQERLEGDVGVLQVARLGTRSPAVCRAARTRW
jgi:PhnB protein